MYTCSLLVWRERGAQLMKYHQTNDNPTSYVYISIFIQIIKVFSAVTQTRLGQISYECNCFIRHFWIGVSTVIGFDPITNNGVPTRPMVVTEPLQKTVWSANSEWLQKLPPKHNWDIYWWQFHVSCKKSEILTNIISVDS